MASLLLGCSHDWNDELPASTDLGSPRGYRVARVIEHLHSPYSWDACDMKGSTDLTQNPSCLSDLKDGLCKNRIDFVFMTDHPNNMAQMGFQELLLYAPGDQLTLDNSGNPIANTFTNCPNGQQPILMAGYEDALMAIGMTQHLDSSVSVRSTLYTGQDPATVSNLQSTSNALVIIPHTESRADSLLATLGMDGIEIYNFHANLDPKIRSQWLGLEAFQNLPDLFVYWIDPYHSQEPDLAFLTFFQIAPVYWQKWNTLVFNGNHVTGLGGTDSHENVLPYTANDGERLDAHRRLLRWMSNHYLVHSVNPTEVKAAVKAGRGWMVTEGLGSPVGMDFYAQTGTAVTGVGETGSFQAGQTHLIVPLPSLHRASPQEGDPPEVIIRLKEVTSQTQAQIVATSFDQTLDYVPTSAGAYRAEVSMIPKHLKGFLDYDVDKTTQEYPWIITNHIYLQ